MLRLRVVGRAVVVVAWRGSKSVTDWVLTDFNQQFMRLHRDLDRDSKRYWWQPKVVQPATCAHRSPQTALLPAHRALLTTPCSPRPAHRA